MAGQDRRRALSTHVGRSNPHRRAGRLDAPRHRGRTDENSVAAGQSNHRAAPAARQDQDNRHRQNKESRQNHRRPAGTAGPGNAPRACRLGRSDAGDIAVEMDALSRPFDALRNGQAQPRQPASAVESRIRIHHQQHCGIQPSALLDNGRPAHDADHRRAENHPRPRRRPRQGLSLQIQPRKRIRIARLLRRHPRRLQYPRRADDDHKGGLPAIYLSKSQGRPHPLRPRNAHRRRLLRPRRKNHQGQ